MASYGEKLQTYELIKRTMLDMIMDLKEIFNQSAEEEDDMIKVHIYFKDMHPETAFNHVKKFILPHQAKIKERDMIFFLQNDGIFSGLNDKKVSYYSRLIAGKTRMAEEDKTAIWDYLEVILYYVNKVK